MTASPALAAGPGWSISSLAQPTSFQAGDAVGIVQNVYVNATGGTFTLAYESEVTAPIVHDASASAVQTALRALPGIGAGNVRVTGGLTGEVGISRYIVSFVKALGPPVEAGSLSANGELLTGGEKTANVTPLFNANFIGDSYMLTVTNTGSMPTTGTVRIKDALPAGMTAQRIIVSNMETQLFPENNETVEEQHAHGFTCTISPAVQCEYSKSMPPGDEVMIRIPVIVAENASGVVANSATVEGGGVPSPVSTSEPATVPNTVNGTPSSSFGIQDFDVTAYDQNGAPDLQAGDHPNAFTTRFNLTSKLNEAHEEGTAYSPIEEVKEVKVDLPLGLIGNPLAAPQCKETDLTKGAGETACPRASRVGTIDVEVSSTIVSSLGETVLGRQVSAIYNMVPEKGYPAVFGFNLLRVGVLMYANVVHTSSGYDLQVKVPGVVRTTEPEGASVTFFGDPAERDGGSSPQAAFFTNPVNCTAGPLTAKIEADSWLRPANWVVKEATVYPQLMGCDMLQFDPEIEVKPETTQIDTPSGYEVDVKVPQTPNVFPDLATPELRNATVAMPEGVSISPSAANGLVGCKESGPEGIDVPQGDQRGNEVEPGEELGSDGLPRLAPGHCPRASQIGTVEVTTPVLADPLRGHVYLAQPRCGGEGQPPCTEGDATNGNLYGLYLEVAGSGVVVKLKGAVAANTSTGQLTTRFENNPQLPFSELKLQLSGGSLAPLANPQTCGVFTATSDLTPWSTPVTPDATPLSSFPISGCGSSMPFTPPFSAGTILPAAGAFSPFTLTFSRHDGEQDLSGISVTTPPGLLGMLSQVQLCPEPQASQGTCGPQSLVGHTQVAAGAGSHPFWVGGNVFLTGPYKGQPFGLSIVTPAKAGPFDLGNVIVRAAIHVDPHTSALTVVSDPLPQIIDGVPLRIQTVNATIDKQGFMFNPTNCDQQQVTGTITSAQGATASVSSPFAVTGCAGLPFKPVFTASTQGKTSKANGASLVVKVAQKPGEANIHKVNLQLPLILPARLTTLQKACTEAQFNTNPAGCPAASVIGTATAITPVLSVPLTGPAYLVSHGGAAFPDVEFVLQGQGVTIVLDGKTDIKKGITYSNFETVPDAPISTFETNLPEGPHSALTANGNLCSQTRTVTVRKRVLRRVHGRLRHMSRTVRKVVSQPLSMPTTITGQNGAQVKQTTNVAVTGCPKHKNAKKKRKRKTKGKAKVKKKM
jgi:hypothetical protein